MSGKWALQNGSGFACKTDSLLHAPPTGFCTHLVAGFLLALPLKALHAHWCALWMVCVCMILAGAASLL